MDFDHFPIVCICEQKPFNIHKKIVLPFTSIESPTDPLRECECSLTIKNGFANRYGFPPNVCQLDLKNAVICFYKNK